MPPFGSRKARTPEIAQPEVAPEPALPPATERLNALLAEQSEINATLAEHREKRAELLCGDGSLGAIRALATEDDGLRLRLEQIALKLPGIERELAQERREEWERAWQSHRPGLAAAETELTAAIRTFYAALRRAHELHSAARAFGDRVRNEFVRPPPTEPINNYSLHVYLQTVEQRQAPRALPAPMLDLMIEAPLHIPPQQRFVPHRVSVSEIEAISAIAPPRRVKINFGPVRTAHLNAGIARMHAGETHIVNARAAYALVHSGIGIYTDVDTAESVETATA